MRKLVILLLAAFLISGCSKKADGSPFNTRHFCIDGVTYYSLGSSLAPAFNREGTLKLCTK